MITAKEAQSITNNYIQQEITKHIRCIEELITKYATEGKTSIYYGSDLPYADPRIKNAIYTILEDAGYYVRWCKTTLYVGWKE